MNPDEETPAGKGGRNNTNNKETNMQQQQVTTRRALPRSLKKHATAAPVIVVTVIENMIERKVQTVRFPKSAVADLVDLLSNAENRRNLRRMGPSALTDNSLLFFASFWIRLPAAARRQMIAEARQGVRVRLHAIAATGAISFLKRTPPDSLMDAETAVRLYGEKYLEELFLAHQDAGSSAIAGYVPNYSPVLH